MIIVWIYEGGGADASFFTVLPLFLAELQPWAQGWTMKVGSLDRGGAGLCAGPPGFRTHGRAAQGLTSAALRGGILERWLGSDGRFHA